MNKIFYVITKVAPDGNILYLERTSGKECNFTSDPNKAAIWKTYGNCALFAIKMFGDLTKAGIRSINVIDRNKKEHKVGEAL